MKHSYRAVDSTEFTAFSISKGMFMNLLKYKGKHIRVSDKSLVFRFSAGSLFLLFLAVIMLLNLKSILTTDWKSVSFLQDGNVHLVVTPYRIVTIVVAALVCVLAALFYRRFQYDRVKQLFHRQKLARMLLENGWYESESTQDSGFFKDLPATTKKEKITYFPKVYYRMEHGLLYIRTEITLGKYQEQLLHLEKKLETGLYCELVSKELKDSYVEYVLLYDTIANRITINEVQAEHGSFPKLGTFDIRMAVIIFFTVTVFLSVYFPALYKLGYEKTKFFFVLVIMASPILFAALFKPENKMKFDFLNTVSTTMLIIFGIVISLIIFSISAILSIKFFEKSDLA